MVLSEQLPSIGRAFRDAVDHAEDGVIVMEGRFASPAGPRILYANRRAAELTGLDPDDFLGRSLDLLLDVPAREDALAKLSSLGPGQRSFHLEAPLAARAQDSEKGTRPLEHRFTFTASLDGEGRVRTHSLTFRPAGKVRGYDEGGSLHGNGSPPASPAVGESSAHHFPPATADRSLEETLEDCRSKSLALAAGSVAHDFKNSLQAITSSLEMARLHAEEDSPVRDALASAQEALDRADSLARQMMAFTKGEKSARSTLSLGELLEQLVRMLSTPGSEARIDLTVPDDLHPVHADAFQISQVFQNILINARQAMPGGGTVEVFAGNVDLPEGNRLGLGAGDHAAVAIRDRGCGIPPGDLPRIFDLYYTTKEDGHGIGLAACREVVERHGGKIAVESRVGVGTEFVVFLPAHRTVAADEDQRESPAADAASAAAQRLSRPPALPPLEPHGAGSSREMNRKNGRNGNAATIPEPIPATGNACLLVVDDEVAVARAVEKLLEHLGYTVRTASTGAEAIELYRYYADSAEPIDAVLLDMTLPGGLSGREVKEEIRSLDQQARVIATSGHFDENSVEEFLADDWSAVLPKPFPMEKLSRTVAEVLQN